jgi:hypothetical protein
MIWIQENDLDPERGSGSGKMIRIRKNDLDPEK